MTDLEARLGDLFEPVRSSAVGLLLEALASAIDGGGEVEAEPVRLAPDGTVVRSGVLSVPERGDLAVTRAGRRLIRRVEEHELLAFEPVTLVFDGGFTAVIGPFHWGEAELIVEARQAKPDWGPLRLWYLEWFQSRVSDVAPDLSGAVHRLEGPVATPQGWRLGVDFGSAPVGAASDLMAAILQSGALRVRFTHLD